MSAPWPKIGWWMILRFFLGDALSSLFLSSIVMGWACHSGVWRQLRGSAASCASSSATATRLRFPPKTVREGEGYGD